MPITQRYITRDTRILVLIALILTAIGGIFIYSSSSVYALEKFGTANYFVLRQIIGFVIGIFGLIAIQFIPSKVIQKLSPYILLASIGLTAMTFIPYFSRRIHGASRWISIGGIAFQPSELLKISIIIYVSYILAKKDWSQASIVRDYMPLLLIIGMPCALILAQPDFGLTATLALTIFLMFFLASFQLRHLLFSLLVLVPVGISLMLYRPYRLKRILVFLNPWEDPLGSGFQIIQSLIAVGSGHFWGLGIGNSRQKFFYLPMQHTDFIFSIIAEETGFIGTGFIISLYILLLYFGLRISWRINDKFSSLVIAGFSMATSLQAIINIAVTTGLLPTKGIGLPFVSGGNTSLVCNLLMVGIVINLVREYA
jgi:cell division protein FtsW